MTLLDYTDYNFLVITDLYDNALGGSHNVHVMDQAGSVQTQAMGFSTLAVRRASWTPPFTINLGGFGSGDNAMRVAGVLGQVMTLPFGSIVPGDYNANANTACSASTACFSPPTTPGGTGTLNIGPNNDNTHNSQYKYVIAHEFGHAIQDRASGTVHLDYARDPTLDENGPCGCGFVSDPTDRAHCLQSRQNNGATESESFAHYVAANTWNGSSGACTFVYYKNFREDTGSITKPPFAKSCSAQTKWLENHCVAPSRGVEWDWLNFFRGAGASGAIVPIADVHGIFRQACGGTCTSSVEPSFTDLQNAALAYYGGNSFDARYLAFKTGGTNFGVNH
jgi:hypothetical protein